jgi:hypothetical protein
MGGRHNYPSALFYKSHAEEQGFGSTLHVSIGYTVAKDIHLQLARSFP